MATPVFPPRLPGAVEAKASRAPFQGSSLQMHSHLSVPLLPHIPNAPQRRVGLTSWRGTGATSSAPGFGPPARANGQASRGVAVSPARPPRELSCSIQKCMLSGEPPLVPPARTPAAPGEGRLAGVPAAPIAFPAGREHSPSPLNSAKRPGANARAWGAHTPPRATQPWARAPRAALPRGREAGASAVSESLRWLVSSGSSGSPAPGSDAADGGQAGSCGKPGGPASVRERACGV